MAMQNINLAEIYGNIDNARAQKAQQEAMRKQQEYQQYQIGRQMRDDQRSDAVRGAYSITPEGGLDEQVTLANLYKVDPMQAMQFKTGQDKARAEAQKLQIEQNKASLENKKATASYLRDRLAGVNDEQSYQQAMQEAKELGAGFVNSAPANFDPNWVRSNLLTADKFLEQSTPKYEKVDLGGKIQVVDVNPFTNPSIKNSNFNKTQTPDSIASNALTRRGQDITMRGQNLTDARGREANLIAQAKANNPEKTPLSASAQKEVFEADEIAQSSSNALNMLKQAKELNKKAYSGVGAKTRAQIASNLGFEQGGANETIDLDNLMTGQALESLKATFGGMPTEGERKILLDIQASADKTPKQREAILDRAIQSAERRMKFAQSKGKALRTGKYFNEQPEIVQDAPKSGFTKNQDGSFNYGF